LLNKFNSNENKQKEQLNKTKESIHNFK